MLKTAKFRDGIIAKKRRIMGHREALESCYFGHHSYLKGFRTNGKATSVASVPTKRVNETIGVGTNGVKEEIVQEEEEETPVVDGGKPLGLDLFTKKLSKLVKFNGYEVVATLKFGDVNTGM